MTEDDLFDVDVSKITGEVTTSESSANSVQDLEEELLHVQDAIKDKEIIVLPNDNVLPSLSTDDWESCLARMNKHCEDAWICLPVTRSTYLSCHVEECSSEEFVDWLNYICPSLKGQHKPIDYAKVESRHKSIIALSNFFSRCKFPKGSMQVQKSEAPINTKKKK